MGDLVAERAVLEDLARVHEAAPGPVARLEPSLAEGGQLLAGSSRELRRGLVRVALEERLAVALARRADRDGVRRQRPQNDPRGRPQAGRLERICYKGSRL